MQENSIYRYFFFGTCVRYLQDCRAGYIFHGDNYIEGNISAFIRHIDELGLKVTQKTSYDLIEFNNEFKNKDKEYCFTKDDAERLSSIVTKIRNTLEAELQCFGVYAVTPKRIDIEKLKNNVPGLFAKNSFEQLSHIAQYDFIESGKCIAYERPTAAAFHLLRGTEEVLRSFHKHMIKQKRCTPPIWGNIIDQLRKSKKCAPYKALIANLDNIRHNYRNPTQHPEKIYDIDEAQDLFGLCIDVVNKMCIPMIKKKSSLF